MVWGLADVIGEGMEKPQETDGRGLPIKITHFNIRRSEPAPCLHTWTAQHIVILSEGFSAGSGMRRGSSPMPASNRVGTLPQDEARQRQGKVPTLL